MPRFAVSVSGNTGDVSAVIDIDVERSGFFCQIGQAASESIGHRQFSGTGGQADFVRGAAWSKGGRSIIAFHSTAAKGKLSRIVSRLGGGAIVTTTRTDIHYIVTEYGIADMRGKSVHERANALINIAHPDFRADLRKEFNKLFTS